MRVLTSAVRIQPAEEVGYDVYVPALPGCVTQGDTCEAAVAMARELIEGFVKALVLGRVQIHQLWAEQEYFDEWAG